MPVKKKSFLNSLRRLLQSLIGVVALNSFIPVFWTKRLYGGILKQYCAPVLNCYGCPSAFFACPIGSIQHILLITRPVKFSAAVRLWDQLSAYLQALVTTLTSWPMALTALVGLGVGRLFCGMVCPFGFVQDMFFKIKAHKVTMHRCFSWGRYLVLVVLVLIIPFFTQLPWFCKLCPQGNLEAGIPFILWNPTNSLSGDPMFPTIFWFFWVKVAILVAFLGLFIFIKRPFCRAVCPLGAIFGLFNRVSVLQMKVDEKIKEFCKTCNQCRDICPTDINIYEDANSPDCVRCLLCTTCPSVSLTWVGGRRGTPAKAIGKRATQAGSGRQRSNQ
jgi:ferredoxin-type protein NapH